MAVGIAEEGVSKVKEAFEKCAKEQQSYRQLRASFECETQLEFVETIEGLVEVDEILRVTKWSQEDLVSNCAELKKKMARLLQKENEVRSLQSQLEARERELDELKRRRKE
ncbi:hypothetical protein COOONC_25716, partial [Cooperia oncophora]